MMAKLQTISFISFSDIQTELDGKHHQNYLYDYLDAGSHFYKWCDKMGFGEKDPDGRDRGASQIWFKLYNEHPEGNNARPETLDFISYMHEHDRFDPYKSLWYIPKETYQKDPAWVSAILSEIIAEYGHLFDDDIVVNYDN
jgi:hypothetical protein